MSETTFSQEDLETFKWDEGVPGVDFFSEVATPEEKPAKEPAEKKEEVEADSGKTEEGEEIDLFGELSEDEPGSPTEDEGEEEDQVEGEKKPKGAPTKKNGPMSNIEVASFLKEKGIIDFELEEGEELDELDAEEIIENGFEASVESRLEETLTGLPDSVKNLIKFVNKGGDPDEYYATIASSVQPGITTGLDITEEDNQIKFMKFQLKQDGHDDEYVDFQIETMKESGRLEGMSTKAFAKWKLEQSKKDAELVTKQNQAVEAARQSQLEYKKNLTKKLAENKNIKSLNFNRQDSRELPDYIGTANVTLEDGRRISPFHKDLFETMKDPEKVLVLAKLIKNGLDFKDIEKTVATKQAQELKQNIQRQKTGRAINSAGGSSQTKRLSDYFPD